MAERKRCNDCAFTHGTEASNSPHTLVVANMCALTGEVFECHINKDEPCQGWAEARAARKASGKELSPHSLSIASMLGELTSECVRLAKIEDDAANNLEIANAR